VVLWLSKFARVHDKALERIDFDIYVEALSDIDPHTLDRAFKNALQTCKFFPKPADIRECIDEANAKVLVLRAEAAWEYLLDWIRRFYSVDIGITKRATELDAKTWAASKAAGGLPMLATCATADLVWRKKDFIEYYKTIHETGKAEFLLTDSEAKALILKLASDVGYVQPKPQLESGLELKNVAEIVDDTSRAACPPLPVPINGPRFNFKPQTPKSIAEQKTELRKKGFAV
jgi:hypothetical protein